MYNSPTKHEKFRSVSLMAVIVAMLFILAMAFTGCAGGTRATSNCRLHAGMIGYGRN